MTIIQLLKCLCVLNISWSVWDYHDYTLKYFQSQKIFQRNYCLNNMAVLFCTSLFDINQSINYLHLYIKISTRTIRCKNKIKLALLRIPDSYDAKIAKILQPLDVLACYSFINPLQARMSRYGKFLLFLHQWFITIRYP